jgi:hypothetical protein
MTEEIKKKRVVKRKSTKVLKPLESRETTINGTIYIETMKPSGNLIRRIKGDI